MPEIAGQLRSIMAAREREIDAAAGGLTWRDTRRKDLPRPSGLHRRSSAHPPRTGCVTRLGRDLPSRNEGVVLKELHRPVREFPPADLERSVWTRLVLPWRVEREGGTSTDHPSVHRRHSAGRHAPVGRRSHSPPCLTVAIDTLRALDAIHGLGLGPRRRETFERHPGSGDGARLAGGSEPDDPTAERPVESEASASDPEALARYRLTGTGRRGGRARRPGSDLYSLGAVLYGCLTGTPLHAAEDAGALLRSQLIASPTSVRARGIAVPRVLDEILDRLLRTDPRERYASAPGPSSDLLETERRLRLGESDPPLVGRGCTTFGRRRPSRGSSGEPTSSASWTRCSPKRGTGQGSLVRLEATVRGTGRAGILDEIAERAAQHGDLVLRAEARELEAPRPFGLLDGLASSLLEAAAADPSLRRCVSREPRARWGPELRTVLPSLAELLAVAEQEGSRRSVESRILDALTALFDALGWEGRPAVLLLDDCQWADELSLRVVGRWALGETGPAVRDRGGGAPPGGARGRPSRDRAGRTRARWSFVHSTTSPRATS